MKAVRLLVESQLPPELRNYNRDYTAGGFNDLLADIGRQRPEMYSELIGKIADIGREASFTQGETLTLDDLRPVMDREGAFAFMDNEIRNAKRESASDEEFKAKRMKIWARTADDLEKATQKGGMAVGNNMAYAVVSGARGKPAQLKAMLTTPGIYADAKGVPVPLFVRRSHAEGLRPAEYLASTFGARSTVISTKNSTAKGGDLAKQMVSVAAPIVVTSRDGGDDNGIDLDIDDASLRYRVLAQAEGGWPAGTVLSTRVIADLKRKGVKDLLVHSPLTDTSVQGISAWSVGGVDGGKLPGIGDARGITSAQAIGEPITQMALNAKHQGGVAGTKKTFAGFDVINQLVQSPEAFADRAAVSEVDGTVTDVKEAPQGGKIVRVNDEEHYVPPGYDITVKLGDKVEAGDQLSDGIIDPHDIVRLRGLGEGRKYYAQRLKQALDDSGIKTDLKHTEMIARAALDHVSITDPDGIGDYLPDDVVSYNAIASNYVPPAHAVQEHPEKSIGMFLQQPALHYTIGTRITPRIAAHMAKYPRFSKVAVTKDAPGFTPEMSRLRTASHSSNDWLAKGQSSYISKNLIESAVRGEDTNIGENVHFAPRLAVGVGFGDNAFTTGKF